MFCVVLMNRELPDSFAMLADPLPHGVLVLLRHRLYGETFNRWNIPEWYLCLGNRIVRDRIRKVVGRPLCCSFQRLFHVVAKVSGIFQQSASRVLEVAHSMNIFNLNCQANLGLNAESWT